MAHFVTHQQMQRVFRLHPLVIKPNPRPSVIVVGHGRAISAARIRPQVGPEDRDIASQLPATRFSEPYSRFDHCVIAWGGVIAQVRPAASFDNYVIL
jgi:hypothetical protein